MENLPPMQAALRQYNQLHPHFTGLVEHLQEHPDFQLPAVSWQKVEENMVEFCFLNNQVRLHFEVVKHKSRLFGRITLEKATRGADYRDLGRPVFFDPEGHAWLGQPSGTQLQIDDDVEALAAYFFTPLVPQESGLTTSTSNK